MKYRNIKTGVEIDVLSECGGDWVLVEEPKKKSGGKKGGKKAAAEKVDEPAESADSSEDVKESDE